MTSPDGDTSVDADTTPDADTADDADGSGDVGGCVDGTVDVDHDPENGCECTVTSETDVPDDAYVDANCDGIDGDLARTIFISASGATSGQGRTADAPVSLDRASVINAGDPSRDQLLLAAGEYAIEGPFELLPGMHLVGNYSADYSERIESTAVVSAASTTALTADGIDASFTSGWRAWS